MTRFLTRETLLVAAFALIAAFALTYGVSAQPTYTDSYYHVNAATRLATGDDLTDTYAWVYIGQPPDAAAPITETPSHLYWMPLASMLSGLFMAVMGSTAFAVAQVPMAVCYAGTIGVAYWLGRKIGGGRRHAVVAALLTAFSGFFVNFWGQIDTFAPYALIGSLCLMAFGRAVETRRVGWWLAAGLLAGLGHLTRSDGLLLVMVGGALAVNPWWRVGWRSRPVMLAALAVGYLLVMTPWFLRMLDAVGAPLPLGGLSTAFLSQYDDLFRYPPDASAAEFFADGLGLFIESRVAGLSHMLQNLIAVEGLVVMTPLMLIGAARRFQPFTWGFALFAVGIHLAMALVFPYPSINGGLFHAVAALVPWWAAFGVAGLDDVVDAIAARRKRWRPASAKRIFSVGLVLVAVVLTVSVTRFNRSTEPPEIYAFLTDNLPSDARLLINDPAALYYHTGLGGAALPNESPEVIAAVAAQYGLTHVVLEGIRLDEDGNPVAAAIPSRLIPILSDVPDFLTELDSPSPSVRVYVIDR